MLSSSQMVPPCKGSRWIWFVAALVIILIGWPYVYCATTIVFNYAYWVVYYSSIRIADPALAYNLSGSTAAVPKLLHQTWRDDHIPKEWQHAQESCKQVHTDYEYRLWTDEAAEQLISSRFPWFIDRYRSYTHRIQRADALRYFVLYEYGGIYLDLDIRCIKSLDFLRAFNFTAPKTYPIGLSNDVMSAQPKDPFLHRLIHNLDYWDRWFFIKYATVMFSTGPMFVTVQYSLYSGKDGVSVLPADVYGKYHKGPEAAMEHLKGSSWHGEDARVVFWIEHSWTWLLLLLLLLGAALGVAAVGYSQTRQQVMLATAGSHRV